MHESHTAVTVVGGLAPALTAHAPAVHVVTVAGGMAPTLIERAPAVHVVTVAEQGPAGPQGPPGPPGPIGDAGGALLVTNRLSEFAADPTAQADAQSNLGLGAVDPLAYYILAKA